MGLGQIYFNLQGREGEGIVSRDEYTGLAEQLSKDLLELRDPTSHTRIVRAVYKRDDVYSGPFLGNAADLQVGLEDGYRVSWQTTLGGSPPGIVYPNMKKWSGDHAAYDYWTIAGVLVSSRKIEGGAPRMMDVAPTVLKYFGVAIPNDIDGKPLF